MKRFILFLESFILIMIPISYNFIPLQASHKILYIPSSDSSLIIETLQKHHYHLTWIDKVVISLNKKPKEGWYDINITEDGRFNFFYKLHEQETNNTINVVIFAGETKEELVTRLSNDMNLDKDKLLKSYNSLASFQEGDILAGDYNIALGADENVTMDYIFLKSKQRLAQFAQKYPQIFAKKRKVKDIYTIASIIQKETYHIDEMPKISSVIYNRLAKNMRLQMDGTLNYGKYSHEIITPERIKSDNSRYNTYKYKGLPPHPISTVSIEALEATINPIKSDYLYFMLNKDGKHDFVSTYKKHISNIEKFREDKVKKSFNLNIGGDTLNINWTKVGL